MHLWHLKDKCLNVSLITYLKKISQGIYLLKLWLPVVLCHVAEAAKESEWGVYNKTKYMNHISSELTLSKQTFSLWDVIWMNCAFKENS